MKMSSDNQRKVRKTGDIVKKSTRVKSDSTNKTSVGNLVVVGKKECRAKGRLKGKLLEMMGRIFVRSMPIRSRAF